MRLRVAPVTPLKPRNPFAGFAKQRAAGSHDKPLSSERQAAKRALKKVKLEPDEQ
jgi:hypothetical protein